MKDIKKNLKELGLSKNEIEIYIVLTQLGEAKASVIAKKAELPRTTTLGILERLIAEKLISEHRYRNTAYYWIESPSILKNGLMNKLAIADQLQNILSDLYRSEAKFPHADIYDTKAGVKNFIEKALLKLPKNSTIYTIDSPNAGNYRRILSEDYQNLMISIKSKRQILTNILIPFGSYKTIDKDKIIKQNIIIREMPEEIEFHASIWLIENSLVLFSGQFPFIASVTHSIIADSFKSIYNYFWNKSTIKFPPNRIENAKY